MILSGKADCRPNRFILAVSFYKGFSMAAEPYFCPKPVADYHAYLQHGVPNTCPLKYAYAYLRNMSYTLQYLEFLDDMLKNVALHKVAKCHSWKTFIVNGCGFMEALLWMLLKGNGFQKTKEWEVVHERRTNEVSDSNGKIRYVVTQHRKLDAPIDVQMRFIEMCHKAEDKRLLGENSAVYGKLSYLRDLRNRVHVHLVDDHRGTDWWKFEIKDVDAMKLVLESSLKADIFGPLDRFDELFSWLLPSHPGVEMPVEIASVMPEMVAKTEEIARPILAEDGDPWEEARRHGIIG